MREPRVNRRRFVAGQRARQRRPADELPVAVEAAPVEAAPADSSLPPAPPPPPESTAEPTVGALPEVEDEVEAEPADAAGWYEPAETAEPAEPAEPSEPGEPRSPKPAPSGLQLAVAALAVAALVLAGLLAWRLVAGGGSAGVDAARRTALSAAKSAVPTVLSYNYQHLGADFAKAEGLLAGPARRQYRESEKALRQTVPQSQTVLDTAYIDGGVEQAVSAQQISLLLFMDQISTHKGQSQPTLEPIRVRVVMVHRGNRWLIDQITRIT